MHCQFLPSKISVPWAPKGSKTLFYTITITVKQCSPILYYTILYYTRDWKSQHYISNTGLSLYSRFVSSVKRKTKVNKGALYSIKKRSKYRKKTIEYRQPSLFAVFLSANSLIHIEKLLKNADFLVRNGLFICKFSIRGPRWRNLYTANNEASQRPYF